MVLPEPEEEQGHVSRLGIGGDGGALKGGGYSTQLGICLRSGMNGAGKVTQEKSTQAIGQMVAVTARTQNLLRRGVCREAGTSEKDILSFYICTGIVSSISTGALMGRRWLRRY